MVKYKCLRCGYIASQRSHFKNHINRKNICKPILEDISMEQIKIYYKIDNYTDLLHIASPNCSKLFYNKSNATCEYCLKTFSRNDSLQRHLKTCKKKNTSNVLTINQNEETNKIKSEIEQLKNMKQTELNEIKNIKKLYVLGTKIREHEKKELKNIKKIKTEQLKELTEIKKYIEDLKTKEKEKELKEFEEKEIEELKSNLDIYKFRTCTYCSKIFSNKAYLSKHLNICNEKILSDMNKKNQSEENLKLQKEVEELKTFIKNYIN